MTTEIDELEMENTDDFIKQTRLTMHVLLIHENPLRNKATQQEMIHWSCKIINAEKKYSVIYFSKGKNVRQWCYPPQTGHSLPIHVPHNKIGQTYDGPFPPFENDQDKKIYKLCSQVEPPYLTEVLDVLARDICLVEQTGDFERWTQAVKTTPDSLTARTVYEIIVQQRLELIALLEEEAFHRLLYEIDRPESEIVEEKSS